MRVLGIDIGGTGIKGAPVDTASGKLLAARKRIKTPQPATPQAVARACEDIGFFTIVGHGVAPAVIAAATTAARQFFALPADEKARVRSPDAVIARGYRGVGYEGLAGTRADQTPPDLKEIFHVGPPDFPRDAYHDAAEAQPHFIDNVWPPSPAASTTAPSGRSSMARA